MHRTLIIMLTLMTASCGAVTGGSEDGASRESPRDEDAWTSPDVQLMQQLETWMEDPKTYADARTRKLFPNPTGSVVIADPGEFWLVQIRFLDGERTGIEASFSDGDTREIDPQRIGPSEYIGHRKSLYPVQLRRVTDGYFKGWGMTISYRDGTKSAFSVELSEPEGFNATWGLQ